MKSVFVFILVLFCTLAQSHAQLACREIEVTEEMPLPRFQNYCHGSELFNEELFYTDLNLATGLLPCCQPMSTGYECDPPGLRDNGMFYFNYCIPKPDEPSSEVCHCRSILAAAIPDLKIALESDDDFDGNCETLT